jgi:hypothetical protein
MFTTKITDVSNSGRYVLSPRLSVAPNVYSATAQGGFQRAEYAVLGDEQSLWDVLSWLGYKIETYNEIGTLVWAGYVVEATVTLPNCTVGLSLEPMFNRVRIRYNFQNLNGEQEDGITDWAVAQESIDRFGTKETVLNLSDAKADLAVAKRDTYLQTHGQPVPIVTFEKQQTYGATLIASGAWYLLNWNYYDEEKGREVYENNGNLTVPIGWQLTDTTIGFRWNRINDALARLHVLPSGVKIKVTGSVSNNQTFFVTNVPDETAQTIYTATTISFDPADDIMDSAAGLGVFRDEEMIRITGTLLNDRDMFMKKPGDDHVEASGPEGPFVPEGAGRSVTITMGNALQVEQDVNSEGAGASITLAVPAFKIAQPFRLTATAAWQVKEIACRIQRVGNPSDQLRYAIYSDSSGSPGSSLASILLVTADIPYVMEWMAAELASPLTLNPGTTYWLVIDRTGSAHYTDFFQIQTGDDPLLATAPGVDLKWYDGSSWIAEPLATGEVKHCLSFQLWALQDTLTILKSMVEASQFVDTVTIPVASGILDYQYKDGTQSVQAEAERILKAGTASGLRLLVAMDTAFDMVVTAEVAAQRSTGLLYDRYGKLQLGNGGMLEDGVLPVGRWLYLPDVPPQAGYLNAISPLLIQEAEYDARSNDWRLTPWAMNEDEDI